MTDYQFIMANYGSFVDNVLLNRTSVFWADLLAQPDGFDNRLQHLRDTTKAWRKRLETAADLVDATRAVEMVDPHHTEEWYAAIDRDIEYQNEFRGED